MGRSHTCSTLLGLVVGFCAVCYGWNISSAIVYIFYTSLTVALIVAFLFVSDIQSSGNPAAERDAIMQYILIAGNEEEGTSKTVAHGIDPMKNIEIIHAGHFPAWLGRDPYSHPTKVSNIWRTACQFRVWDLIKAHPLTRNAEQHGQAMGDGSRNIAACLGNIVKHSRIFSSFGQLGLSLRLSFTTIIAFAFFSSDFFNAAPYAATPRDPVLRPAVPEPALWHLIALRMLT
ncbi:hypothetical protein B0H14DRAFT_2587479 [Mycena olivaceomarginata]|nr:hypothetical protein B0H14DRAFT_2587479 [Mycena olivaceomarginata]